MALWNQMNQIIKAEVQYKLQDIDSVNRQADDTLQFDVVAPMFEGKGLFSSNLSKYSVGDIPGDLLDLALRTLTNICPLLQRLR